MESSNDVSQNIIASSGSEKHRELTQTIYDSLIECGLHPTITEKVGRNKPDMRWPSGEPIFDEYTPLWIEVETSTLRKPANIIKRIPEAQDNGAKLVYAVSGYENSQEGEGIERLRRILVDPPLVRKQSMGQTEFYTDTARLLTTEGDYVAVRRDQMSLGGDQVWWQDHETDEYHRKLNDESHLTIRNTIEITEGIPQNNAPCRVSLAEEREESYRVVEADGTEWYTDTPNDELFYIRRPLVPEALGVDTDSAISDIECLIATEHAVYHQPLLPPTETTKLVEIGRD